MREGLATAASVAIALWVAVATFPSAWIPFVPGLDTSWVYLMNTVPAEAFGRGTVFTYGPLAFLVYAGHAGSHILAAVLLRFVTQAGLVAILVKAARLEPTRTALCAVALAFAAAFGLGYENLLLLTFVAAVLLATQEHRPFLGGAFAACGSALWYMKLTLGIGATAALVGATVVWVRTYRSWRTPTAWMAVHFICAATIGIALLGSLRGLIGWMGGSLDIVDGFSVAMSYAPPLELLPVAIPVAGMFFVLGGWLVLRRSPASAAFFVMAGPVFLGFKAGIVREDGHVAAVFAITLGALSLVLLWARRGLEQWVTAALAASVVVAGIVSLSAAKHPFWIRETFSASAGWQNLRSSVKWSETERWLDEAAAGEQVRDRLSREVLESLQPGRVAIVPFEAIICLANKLNCVPLPTLALYAAYTASLDRRSAAFFSGSERPDAVLVHQAIDVDGRLVALEAPKTFLALLEGYRPARVNAAQLVLKRANNQPMTLREAGEDEIQLRRPFSLPVSDSLLFAALDLRLTLRGRLAKAFLRIPPLNMDITFGSGTERSVRILPETASGGMLINFVPFDIEELGRLFEGRMQDPVRSVTLTGPAVKYYRPTVRVRWFEGGPRQLQEPVTILPAGPSCPDTLEKFWLDVPAGGPPLVLDRRDGIVRVEGWVVTPATRSKATSMSVSLDGRGSIRLVFGMDGSDVTRALGLPSGTQSSGFRGIFPASTLGPGEHDLVFVLEGVGWCATAAQRLHVSVR